MMVGGDRPLAQGNVNDFIFLRHDGKYETAEIKLAAFMVLQYHPLLKRE